MKQACLHPISLRIWHWTNAFVVIVLIATGIYLRIHGIAALKPHDPVLSWHKAMGYAMIMTMFFRFIYTMANKDMRCQYRIEKKDLAGVFPQVRFYLYSIFTGAENPFKASMHNKYNPLQKMAYGALMILFLPVQAVTGLFFADIPVVRPYLLSGNLMGLIDAVHVLFSYLLILYVIVHLYMATLGDTVLSHTKAMITGYEEKNDEVRDQATPVLVETPQERTAE